MHTNVIESASLNNNETAHFHDGLGDKNTIKQYEDYRCIQVCTYEDILIVI